MLKRMIVVMLVAAAILMPSVVFASGAGDQAGAKKVKLLYWTQAQTAHAPMVEAFLKQNPNIEIEQVDMPADEQRQVMRATLSSGTGPDVFYFELGAGHVDPILKANLVIDLEEPAQKFGWKQKLTAFAQAEATHYGKLWAMPNEAEFITMYYNKKILGEFGAKEPQTWDDMIEVLEKIKKDGKYEPIAFGDADKWPALHRISLAYQWSPGGAEAARKSLFEFDSLDTPGYIDGLSIMQKLDGTYMPHILERKMGEAQAVFYSGNAAMMHSGTWNSGSAVKSDVGGDLDFFIPSIPGPAKPNTVAGCGGGWYINSQSKYIDESVKFLDFTISKESTDIWFGLNFLPPIPIDAGKPGVPPMISKAIDSIQKYKMGYFIHHFVSADQVQWIREGYQGLIANTVTPAEFAKKFEEIAKQSRADGFRP
jgi:raffinose/stachyose/melibiose transport system substrate-binding protein